MCLAAAGISCLIGTVRKALLLAVSLIVIVLVAIVKEKFA